MSPRENYLQTLELLHKQREQLANELTELDMIITGLDRLANREAPSPKVATVAHEVMPDHQPIGTYSEMELVPAAEHYLRASGIPQSSQEIADALIARGFRTRSKDFKNTVQALLKRAHDAGRPLRRTGKSGWAIDDTKTSSAA
jgi:hypothetical protein